MTNPFANNLVQTPGNIPNYINCLSILEYSQSSMMGQNPYACIVAQTSIPLSSGVNPASWLQSSHISMQFANVLMNNVYECKERFYITGIRNLRKKINFIRLANEYSNDQISEEEYEHEITSYPDKYIVDIQDLKEPIDSIVIHEIVGKIGGDLTFDEVGEIFSVDSDSLRENFIQLANKSKQLNSNE